jgi:hypothetical protein
MDKIQKIIVYIIILIILGNLMQKNENFSTHTLDELRTEYIFTDGQGNTITVINNAGSLGLKLVQANQPTPIIFTSTPPPSTTATPNTFYAQPPLKMTATVVNNGHTINVNLANGKTIVFTHKM